MKVKKSEIQLLIAVLGILLAVVTYFLVYAKFNDLADSMESQNMSLRSQVSTLEVLDQRKADYLAATEKMQSYITNFESRFPVYITGRQYYDGKEHGGCYQNQGGEYLLWNGGRGSIYSAGGK